MRRSPALIAIALGLLCGYGITRHWNPASPEPAAMPTAAGSDAEAPGSDTVSRAARRVRPVAASATHPLLARAASLAPPALPPPRPGWSADLDALRRRAEQGDAAAASEWLRKDARCYAMMPLTPPDANAPMPTPGFLRAAARRRSRLAALDADVSAAATIDDPAQRSAALAGAQRRLLDECRGYVPEPPAVRYALGEIAARLGSDDDFWRFINDPPFAPGYSRDTEQAIDWARRAPAMVYERALRGDAEAALALGVSYAVDRPRELDAGRDLRLLPATIANDPLQAYRWLSVFLRTAPGSDQAMLARALLNRVGADLSAQQRAEAERWAP
ncbi:MAG: hypothetical protein AMXMBFR59_30780 [Rhodanobacteraceae bacterium]